MLKIKGLKFVQLISLCLLVSFFARGNDVSGSGSPRVTIIIEPTFNGVPLVADSQYYVNAHGDTFYISLLRFYLTNVSLVNASGGQAGPKCSQCSHLYDLSEPATASFSVEMPAASYDRLAFTLGVDSIDNTNGANGGDLDPTKGMYWAWNTGYIMAKLEGTSKVCKTLHHAFEFHVGGYMPPYNTERQIRLDLPVGVKADKTGNCVIRLRANVSAWFPKELDLAQTNSIVIPGKEAAKMADNYAHMFSVISVSNEGKK